MSEQSELEKWAKAFVQEVMSAEYPPGKYPPGWEGTIEATANHLLKIAEELVRERQNMTHALPGEFEVTRGYEQLYRKLSNYCGKGRGE